MGKKLLIFLLVVTVTTGLVLAFVPKKEVKIQEKRADAYRDQVNEKNEASESLSAKPTASPASANEKPAESKPVSGQYSGEDDIMADGIAIEEVTFDGKSFQPQELKVKTGDVVIFRNKSKGNVWPASAPHPSHSAYPEFDAKKSLGPGQVFEFKFNKAGNWKYHDHLNSSVTGTIVVEN